MSVEKPIGLFIGRFQPLHNGHVDAIRQILKKVSKLYVLIGSSNVHDEQNPFTLEERKHMLGSVFVQEIAHNRIVVASIPDFDDHEHWFSVIDKKVKFDIVYTRNIIVAALFRKHKVKVEQQDYNLRFHAINIRHLMKAHEDEWNHLVPEPVVDIIKKHKKYHLFQ